uniref:Uncharacterized protein n=1 Tax=Astyanax mexicanus TaxID=7994 RepID=A0A3B1INV1_ASTMX
MASSADSNASPEMSRNRTHLMCPFCKTTHYSLPEHLRKCMNGRPPAEQKSVLEEAKKNAHRLLKEGRRIEYGIIRRILDSDDPEEKYGSSPPSAEPDESDFPPIKPEPDSSGEYFQEEKMASAGLYFKHSTAHPLLKSFAHYLEVDLENDNFTQEVENVARFMYFMDPKQPSLLFVCQTERTREYFNTLSEVGLSKQTVHNYIKSFHISSTDMELTDLQLYNDCQLYTVLLWTVMLWKQVYFCKASPQVIQSEYYLIPPLWHGLNLYMLYMLSILCTYTDTNQTLFFLSSAFSGEEGRQHPGGRCLKMDEQQAYDLLLQSYPVTLHSAPPKRSERVSVAKEHDRHCYDRWRGDQKQLRVQHVLGEVFLKRKPSESRVRSWIEKQGWTANVPDAVDGCFTQCEA